MTISRGQPASYSCGVDPGRLRGRRAGRAHWVSAGWAGLGLLVAAGGLSASGCATTKPQTVTKAQTVAEAPPVVAARPPEPKLQSASDTHLTLFGELPDRTRIPFQARAASPMKQHSFTTEGADFDVDVSADGKWLVFASTRNAPQPDLYLKAVDGQAVTQLTDDPAADVQPVFSPDGKTIAFASHRSGNWDLWIIALAGGQAAQITRSPQHEVHPTFAPDGKRLAYCVFNDKASQWELWMLQLDQPGTKRMIGLGLFPEWSPVADRIVYQKARERGGRWFSIWCLELEKGEPKFPVELASSQDMALIQPSWSADGVWITYGTAMLGTGEGLPGGADPTLTRGDIWIIRADGSSPLQLTDGAGAHFGSVWGMDQRVYFTSPQSGAENIWSVRPYLDPITQGSTAAEGSTADSLKKEAASSDAVPSHGG